MSRCEIAIVGAGPYGLSAAAHLSAAGRSVRVFGQIVLLLDVRQNLLLRSPWAASHLSDPKGALTLDAFKSSIRTEFSAPVPLDRFVAYGRWFQCQVAPTLDSRKVACIEADGCGFRLRLEDGEVVTASRVVVASGIVPFAWRPPEFLDLSPDLASHSSEWRDVRRFASRRLAVVGGGQSALESAALLHEAGAQVEVMVRNPAVIWLHNRPLLHRWPLSAMLYAWPDVGPALVSHLVARPDWFKRLPRDLQDKLGPRCIRAAGAEWLKPRVKDVVPITTGRVIKSAARCGQEVKLTLDDGRERRVDHVLLATGYRLDLELYPFLSQKLLKGIRRVGGYPVLKEGFESSVPGLHFIGAPAARSFGRQTVPSRARGASLR